MLILDDRKTPSEGVGDTGTSGRMKIASVLQMFSRDKVLLVLWFPFNSRARLSEQGREARCWDFHKED